MGENIIKLSMLQAGKRPEPPEVTPDPNADGAALLDEVYGFLGRFVAYPSFDARVAHTLWVAHAHLMDAWESTPRIAFLSAVRGSGKTRALEISALLVPRPLLVVNVSAPYLFRRVADPIGLPTVLYDECDTVFSKNADLTMKDVCGLLNAGHRKGAVSGRCVTRGKDIEPEDFPAYCAVALAGLGRCLPDTIISRSVVVRMRRRAPNESVEPYRPRLHDKDGHALRDRLAAWAAGIEPRIEMPELPKEIQDRDADVWEPLIAVADAAGGEWPDRARCSAVALVALLQRGWGVASLSLQLLSDLRAIFGDHQLLPTKDILSLLIELPESAWADYRGKPLTDRGLSNLLSDYEIESKNIRTGPRVVKGYRREDFADAWRRYLPDPTPTTPV
jgi:hypothetical protein